MVLCVFFRSFVSQLETKKMNTRNIEVLSMDKKPIQIVFIVCLLAVLMPMRGLAQVDIDVQPDPKKNTIVQKAKKLAEKTMVHRVDTNYVKTPELPWQISVKSRVAQTDLQMHSTVDGAAVYNSILGESMFQLAGPLQIRPRIMTPVSTSLGVKVGYRGLSASYTFPLGGDNGQSLSFRSIGSFYSMHLRWHKFEDKQPEVPTSFSLLICDPLTGEALGDPIPFDIPGKWHLASPIKIKTLVFDGFYIFNHKKFSYSAAYNQKTIQLRSAGSFIAGIMAYYADLRMDDNRNAEIITYMGGIGRIRQWQGSIGAGYAYNFVPAKGWLIGATAMPMVTLVNRMKMTHYSSNYIEIASDEFSKANEIDDEFIEEYAYDNGIDQRADDYVIHKEGTYSRNNRVALNFTTRLSVTYNWSRYFINVNGQFNNFQYSHKSANNSMHGHLNDWYINAAVGVRL